MITIDTLYTNPSVQAVDAITLGTFPQYDAIVITNRVTADTPASTVVLIKGTQANGGPTWGTYYGRRTYYYDSDGTIRWDASSHGNVNPIKVYGLKWSNSFSVQVLYENLTAVNVGATTLDGDFSRFKFIIVSSCTDADTPATTVFIPKGDSEMGGTCNGGWYGRRWYYFDSNGTIRWDASSHNNVIPYRIYGVY